MHEPRFGILRVEGASMDTAAAGSAQHERRRRAPYIMRLRNHVADLVHGTGNKVHELKFRHRTHAGERCAEGCTHYGGFCDRSVDHPFRAKTMDKAIRDFEGAAVDADVFTQAEDGGVALHLLPDSLADGFEIGELRHRCATNCTIPSNRAASI